MLNSKDVELLKKPNINIIFKGKRTKNNIKTNEDCTIVGVTKKKPKEELSSDEIIPEDKDVVEIEPFKPLHQSKYRPVIGGISGHDYNTSTPNSYSTLGLIVKDNTTNQLVGLTCNHCVGIIYDTNYSIPDVGFDTHQNRYFSQPSIGDGGTSNDIIGSVTRSIPIKFGNSTENLVDAAIVSIDENFWFTIENLTSEPVKFYNDDLWVGAIVSKSGRTTGKTTNGVIDSIDAAVSISYLDDNNHNKAIFTNQILVSGFGFSSPGDSGSVIINNNHVMGLLFAGNSTYAIANNIEHVSSLLEISSWDGEIIVPYNEKSIIYINNRQFSKIRNSHENTNFEPF